MLSDRQILWMIDQQFKLPEIDKPWLGQKALQTIKLRDDNFGDVQK